MKLPAMKYSGRSGRKYISAFGGLNRRSDAAENELIDSENLGADAYPAICPRRARSEYGQYTNPTDIFEWNGHVVIVDGYNLLFDGEIVGNVTPGAKQFAVINTRLVVWPDKVYFDMEDRSFHRMDTGAVADSADTSVYTENSITLGENNVYDNGSEQFLTVNYSLSTQTNKSFVYAKTYTALTWDGNAWIGEGEAETEIASGWTGKYIKLRANAVAGVYNLNVRETEQVHIFGQETTVYVNREYSEDMNELCAEITSASKKTSNPAPEAVYEWTVTFRVIKSGGSADKPLSEIFEVGDWVTLEGIPGAKPSKEYKITAIDGDTRTLTFPNNSFEIYGSYYYVLTSARTEEWKLHTRTTGYIAETPNGQQYYVTSVYGIKLPPLPEGSVIYSDKPVYSTTTPAGSASSLWAWNCKTGEVTSAKPELLRQFVYNGSDKVPEVEYLTFTEGTGIITWAVKVNKGVPGMDFICAHNNRLYGVSNSANALNEDGTRNEAFKSRIIYVSELGMPTHFTTFDGVDTDSYQVAEASNGDFTACCSYGDHVLFFKEHRVIKFYGDYPSAMGFTYDDIEGVKAGCYKSIVVINEVLYYMGRSGYCAYTGTVPRVIGQKLDREYDNVICAADGRRLLLWGKYGNEQELLSYMPEYGIWLRESGEQITAMAAVNKSIYLIIGKKVYTDGGGKDKVLWAAEFPAYDESTMERKRWKYIRLRAEIEADASFIVMTRYNDGEYKSIYTAEKTGLQTINIPLPLNRADRMSIRIEGEGRCVIYDLEREYQTGSVYG